VRRAALSLSLVLALAVPAAARATTYYARAHGSDTSTTCPLGEECSLPHALGLTHDGDSLVLEPGADFTPSSTLVVKHAIDIGGAPGAGRPTIRGGEEEAAIKLSNLAARIHDVNLVASEAFAALEVEEGSAERVLADGEGIGTMGCQIIDATLVDVVCRAPYFAVGMDGGGPVSYSSALRNVTAISSERQGIFVFAPDQFHESRLEAVNVIARGAAGIPDVAAIGGSGDGAAVVHLTSSDYATTEVVGTESSITAAGTNGNIAAPPQFVDAAAGDLHELASSPTVDAGSTDPSVPSLDLDGNPRALASHPACGGSTTGPTDIGAYEYVPPSPLCAAPVPPALPTPARPAAPGTRLGKAKIDSEKGTARFTFSGSGAVTGFACELLRPHRAGKGGKAARATRGKKPRFAACGSPKTYGHLAPGRYTFAVEAQGPGGSDTTPARRAFRIG
jgi:hypothetical protein